MHLVCFSCSETISTICSIAWFALSSCEPIITQKDIKIHTALAEIGKPPIDSNNNKVANITETITCHPRKAELSFITCRLVEKKPPCTDYAEIAQQEARLPLAKFHSSIMSADLAESAYQGRFRIGYNRHQIALMSKGRNSAGRQVN